jgi:ankyrin repeat protein
MFSETECIERREFTLLHKIVLGLVPIDLEQYPQDSTADINARDTNNRTPISLAADRGDLSAVSTLLRYNANLQIGSSCFATHLHFAGCAQDPSCIQPLIDAGAQVDALTDWSQTPLIYVAAYTKDTRHANILLDTTADQNHRDRDSIAPLGWTVIADNLPIALALLARNADIDSASLAGETALSRCVASNRTQILRELKARRASPELQPTRECHALLRASGQSGRGSGSESDSGEEESWEDAREEAR